MATETTLNSARAWSPDLASFAPSEVVPDALILRTSTVVGEVEGDAPFVRVAWVNDASADFTAEGAPIPEADPGLDETLVATGKVSQLVRISREQWSQERTSELLSDSVRRAVVKRANAAYIAQLAPTAPAVTPPPGLLNVPGITDGGVLGYNLDVIVDAIAGIEAAGGMASHIILDPATWALIGKIKSATGSEIPLIGAPGSSAQAPARALLGVPIITDAAMAPGTLLVVDKTAIASAVGQVRVASSEHAYFTSDSIGLLCTWRIGWNVMHPDRIVKIDTGAVSGS